VQVGELPARLQLGGVSSVQGLTFAGGVGAGAPGLLAGAGLGLAGAGGLGLVADARRCRVAGGVAGLLLARSGLGAGGGDRRFRAGAGSADRRGGIGRCGCGTGFGMAGACLGRLLQPAGSVEGLDGGLQFLAGFGGLGVRDDGSCLGAAPKASTIRLLTTLLDHEEYPAGEIAVLYAERWQTGIAFLHLKKTLRGARRVLRGKSETLVRQEAWAFLLVHNMIAAVAARAAALAGIDPDLIPFTAVLGLVRAGIHADTRCGRCGNLPADPLRQLIDDVTAHPRHRPGRKRTSGRTAAERRSRPTEEVTYTIMITPSNLPQWQQTP
jgi:hypothetical protein